MLAWTAHALAVSGLAALAAAAAERALRLCDLPARGAWALAMATSAALPLAAALGAGPPVPSAVLPELGVGDALGGLEAAPGAAGSGGAAGVSLDALVLGGWGLSAAAGLGWIALSAGRLRRSLARTPTRSAGGVTVHLTEEAGPACWSVPGLRARVLLPTWLRDLAPEGRRLAVAHERQHLRRGDSLLTAAGWTLLTAAPWNLPLWWQMRRLRRAVELDCDARVLGAGADPRRYGDLLLAVGGRSAGPAGSALPLSEDAARLEGRIEHLSGPRGPHRLLRAAAFALMALGAGALACEAPSPGPGGEATLQAPGGAASAEGPPELIPYDLAPKLRNPEEISSRLRVLYPDSLERAGVGGSVVLWLRVDETGDVRESLLGESSGHGPLDDAAGALVREMEFAPARRRGEPTEVWVQQRIRFEPGAAPRGTDSPGEDGAG